MVCSDNKNKLDKCFFYFLFLLKARGARWNALKLCRDSNTKTGNKWMEKIARLNWQEIYGDGEVKFTITTFNWLLVFISSHKQATCELNKLCAVIFTKHLNLKEREKKKNQTIEKMSNKHKRYKRTLSTEMLVGYSTSRF